MGATCLACVGPLPHPGCSGFEGGYDTYHCACYMQMASTRPEAHPNTHAAERAHKVERCKANGDHRLVSLGFGDWMCDSCRWVGKKAAS